MKQTFVTLAYVGGLTLAGFQAKRYPELQDALWSHAVTLGVPALWQGVKWFITQPPGNPGSAPGPAGVSR